MTPSQHRILDWLDNGHTGTAREISEGAGISLNTVHNAMRGLHPYLVAVEKRIGMGGEVTVWARNHAVPRPQRNGRPYAGGPILAQALRSRTPLEVAWV